MDPFIIAGISVLYLAMMIIVGNHYAQNGFGPGLIIFGGLFWPITYLVLILRKVVNPILNWLTR